MHIGYRLVIEPCEKQVIAEFNGVTIASSNNSLIMHETRLAPVYYFPRDDVRMDLLERSDLQTYCPFKGNASYWSINAAGKTARNVVWSYETPFDEATPVRGYIAFYWDAMDAWYEDGVSISEPPQAPDEKQTNPLATWLLRAGWDSGSTVDLIEKFCRTLVQNGMPLWRFYMIMRTLHPQLFGAAHYWYAGREGVDTYVRDYATLESAAFRDSPIAPILRGEGGIRRRLDGPDTTQDYPILHELKNQGVTDYIAMPMTFSSGQINVITLASKAEGGFSLAELGHIHEVLPVLSRLFEVHSVKQNSMTLLDTYLGRNTGKRILNGEIKRGDGEDIDAVIWFSDLRNSTALSESLPRARYLEILNSYFDCTAGAVLSNGGEVLKFIGDAVLAIFPFGDNPDAKPAVYAKVIKTVCDSRRQFETINAQCSACGEQSLQYGVALHEGTITYGNIGTPSRLDFTVIGSAVNEASRIQDKCKELEQPFLASARLAQHLPLTLQSLGIHHLRGVSKPMEIFALPAAAADHDKLVEDSAIA